MTRSIRVFILAAVLAVTGSILADNASANSNPPAAHVVGSNVTSTIYGAKASAKDVVSGKVTILADVMVKGKVTIKPSNCKWTGRNWWNSGRGADGKLYWFKDPVPGYVCRMKGSPTGWVKVAGGQTGRNCKNPAKVGGKAPGRVVTGKVLMVRSFTQIQVHVKAEAKVTVTAICGSASGKGSASVYASFKVFMRTRGNVSTGVYNQAIVKATAAASAQIDCIEKPPVVTPACPPGYQGAPPNCYIPAPPCTTCAPPPPPGKVKVTLVKYAFVDGSKVGTPSGFGFTVNGSAFSNTGEVTSVGDFQIGISVTICETNPMGWSADKACETQTVSAAGNTFVFTNRKTTPPPPPPANRPPTGVVKVPVHLIVGGAAGKVCVDEVRDPDGNSATVTASFLYKDEAGTTINLAAGPVFREGDALCQMVNPPSYPTNVKVYATLTDEKDGDTPLFGNFPVVAYTDPD